MNIETFPKTMYQVIYETGEISPVEILCKATVLYLLKFKDGSQDWSSITDLFNSQIEAIEAWIEWQSQEVESLKDQIEMNQQTIQEYLQRAEELKRLL